jgi:hypothetical protein
MATVALLGTTWVVAREPRGDVVPANSPESILRSLTMHGRADAPAEALAAG